MYRSNGAAQPRSRYNDLYAKLGIAPDASQEEIQAAYRVLEKAYCPGGTYADDVMHQAFLEISNAAAILGNPQTRKLYDLNYIDEAGKLTPAGQARAARVRKTVISGGAAIAVIAGLSVLLFWGSAPGTHRKSVQASPPPLPVAAGEPPPRIASPPAEPDAKTEASKRDNESASVGAPAQANAQDYLPPAEVLKPGSDAGSTPGQPVREPSKPHRWTSRQHGHAPNLAKPAQHPAQKAERARELGSSAEVAPEAWERDMESSEPIDRGRIAASASPGLKTAQCLACLTNDRANCSKTCP